MSEKEKDTPGASEEKVRKKSSVGRSSSGKSRIETLAKPKMLKSDWTTRYEASLVWGNQEPIRPISRSALKAVASERTGTMAQSKKNSQENFPEKCCRPEYLHSCGRPSVIWEVSPSAMQGKTTDRVEMLSRHKTEPAGFQDDRPHYPLACGRSSPIWEVSENAKNAREKPENSRLAEPKKTHPSFVPARDVQWPVTPAAFHGQASSRTEMLARPKDRADGLIRHPVWAVRRPALKAVASTRLQELSKPRQLPDEYRPLRDVEWKVPRSAVKVHASERIKSLSQPIVRQSMDHVQFNPDAFKVSESAKNARISSRVNDLAQPVQRSMRIKAS